MTHYGSGTSSVSASGEMRLDEHGTYQVVVTGCPASLPQQEGTSQVTCARAYATVRL